MEAIRPKLGGLFGGSADLDPDGAIGFGPRCPAAEGKSRCPGQSNSANVMQKSIKPGTPRINTRTSVRGGKRTPTAEDSQIVLTIGHSTRALEVFIGLLQAHAVSRVVDVRTVARSRHNPQFNKASLSDSLKEAGVGYVHIPGLGGLRHARQDSLNMGWRNASFRGYADYMQTPEFERGLEELIELANQSRIVLMCAEAVPWRCHRSLIADALLVHGIRVEDIMSSTRRHVHTFTPFAKVQGVTITYPALGLTGVCRRQARLATLRC